MRRRNLLAGIAAFAATGCSRIGDSEAFGGAADLAERMHRAAHRALSPGVGLAREYEVSDISPFFRGNGTTEIPTPEYQLHLANNFVDWRVTVGGLVERPLFLTMPQLRALPQRTQITRHDCVEGWSAIGQWTGPQLGPILEVAGLRPEVRYIVFRCADVLYGDQYYESCGLDDAFHPQTILAHQLNGRPLPERNGAPVRLRIERQLGYKHAKYLTGIEAVASLDGIEGGEGGYWEDRGYQWYAGI